MLVSVIINNYNYSQYIAEAIESVLNQTYKNFELIIVDDGSTDSSRDIIDQFYTINPEKIIKIYKKNGGQGSAFNAGLKVASGQVIAFLDSDDYWFHNKLKNIVAAHAEFDIVEHGMLCSGEHCRWVQTKTNAQNLLKQNGEISRFSETSSLSFRKELLDKIFPIPEEDLKICTESFVLLGAVYHSNKITTLRECLSYYRIHGENNYIDNPNADKFHMTKFINLYNSILKSEKLTTIPFGEEKVIKNLKGIDFCRDTKYAIYGLGRVSKLVTEYLTENNHFISFYIDSNIKNRNVEKKIYHPSNLLDLKEEYDFIIIASSFVDEIKEILNGVSISNDKTIAIY
ncbi:glycosyltransferase [Ureibacillus chungkukjangi]|uniref:glycosyltransferase family 2 protein n=1 Tax=Ureibacillus chungkukjangi TaxID=1202712 RepID=UPI00203BAD8D|nr:glycosyltransferase family 2 protein [Ureibacillus chungkukjangi]MCM3390678.1 glycosyltransferase [Ureibacillus chungkukjangi]